MKILEVVKPRYIITCEICGRQNEGQKGDIWWKQEDTPESYFRRLEWEMTKDGKTICRSCSWDCN